MSLSVYVIAVAILWHAWIVSGPQEQRSLRFALASVLLAAFGILTARLA